METLAMTLKDALTLGGGRLWGRAVRAAVREAT
jgi:hypothetical protein